MTSELILIILMLFIYLSIQFVHEVQKQKEKKKTNYKQTVNKRTMTFFVALARIL